MWRDESVTHQVAHRSLADLWQMLAHIDAVHGLYYLCMHAVFGAWDGGLLALRLPSTVGAALAAAGVGAIGTRLAGRRAGLLAGLVLAFLPHMQRYAQEGRSYALVCAAVTWATYCFVRAMGPRGTALRGGGGHRRSWWAAYTALLSLACWLHVFAALAVVAHGFTLGWLRAPRGVWLRWGKAAATVLTSLLPLVLVSAGQAERQLGWLAQPGTGTWLQFLALSVAALLPSWACRPRADGRDTGHAGPDTERTILVKLALPLLLAPFALLLTASFLRPWFVERYVLYGMVGLALLAGAALDRALAHRHRLAPVARVLAQALSAAVAVAVLLPWSMSLRSPDSRKDNTVAVAQVVRAHARPGDGVLFLPARRREWLLSTPAVYQALDDLALARNPAASATLQGTELADDAIRRRIRAADRIIALTDPPEQPLDTTAQETAKRETLARYFHACRSSQVRGAQIIVYTRSGQCVPASGR